MDCVHRDDAGHGCESECEQRLDGGNVGRRRDSIDTERERFFAGVVPGWEGDRVYFDAERGRASVFVVDGRRRAEGADETFDGSGSGDLVAGWEDDCIYIRRVSG